MIVYIPRVLGGTLVLNVPSTVATTPVTGRDGKQVAVGRDGKQILAAGRDGSTVMKGA